MIDATIRRPRLSPHEALAVAARQFSIEGDITELPSYHDQNFRIDAPDGATYVLKVSRDGEKRDQLHCENAALAWAHEHAPEVPIPHVVAASDGQTVVTVPSENAGEHFARILTHLPGTVLADAAPHSAALLQDLGFRLGQLDAALEGFDHAAANREILWDLGRAPSTIGQYRAAVTDRQHNAIIDTVLGLWDEWVAPNLTGLRRSVIHNDANDYNVLVSTDLAKPRVVSGFIDFGDMVKSYTVCDLAIAIAYVMFGENRPLAAAARVVAGYHEAYPLEEIEVDTLVPLACARLATSVCLSAARRADNPDDEYLWISEAPAWKLLKQLTTVHPQFARAFLRVRGCSLPAFPTTRAVESWLHANRKSFAAVVDPDPRHVTTIVLDLSVGSPMLPDPIAMAGSEALSDVLFAVMADRNAEIGIGRYDEPRLWYTSDAFGDGDDRRTIHIACDLFLPAGRSVHAPLDGVVESVQDNLGDLNYGPTVILRHEPESGIRFYTLYGHLSRPVLSRLSPGDLITAGHEFAELGEFEDNGRWPPHLHFQIITDLLGTVGDFPGVAPPDERDVWTALCPDPNLILGIPDARYASTREKLLERRRAMLSPSLSLAYVEPLHIVRGRGSYLYDDEGREYLDCVNNVCHVGHGHPAVVAAAHRQAAILNTNTRYLHETILDYAGALTATLPDHLSVCFFVNSGSEANDLALRIARTVTRRNDVIVIDGAYHGHTQSLIDASPYKFDGPGGAGRQLGIHPIPMPDPYRGRYYGDDAPGERYAGHVATISEALAAAGHPPAAFIAESLLGCGGQIEPPPEFLQKAFDHARRAGALCVADEVQVGFGRVGSHFWGFEMQHAVPDIVTMGKPIGNGHPLGALVTTHEIADAFANGMEYFNTFGGNPVSCAVGKAVLDVIHEERLQTHAHEVGQELLISLRKLADSHPIIGDVRGRGLFLGIELVLDRERRTPAPAQARYVIEQLRGHRILLSTDGPDHNVLKFKPPMVFSRQDGNRLAHALDHILREDVVRFATP